MMSSAPMQSARPFQAAGRRVSHRVSQRASLGRRTAVRVQAYEKKYPDPQFIKEVEAAFPDQGLANVDEARVLYSALGWTYLDVRPTLEVDAVGKVKNSVNIPFMIAKKKYDPETRKISIVKEENPNFVSEVHRKFPNKETAKLLIACSDGRSYSQDAAEALDEDGGYANMALLKGGYYAWFQVFDNNLRRRNYGEYQERYEAEGDSCGIHSSGAGFDKVDKVDRWVPPKF